VDHGAARDGTAPGDDDLVGALARFRPRSTTETAAVARIRELAATGDPWSRASPLHVTGSAVVVHPPTGRVLLRWHERMRRWLHVGGHVDPGETSPLATALREGREETGLDDLTLWPDAAHPLLVHVAIVPVPAGKGEPAHEHADLRYLLATARPDDVVPESASARLRWLTVRDAEAAVGEDNLRETLTRVAPLLGGDRAGLRPSL
jgi:8-oxo-dGTP pyrophosphatase MutT (NUDIX family)